MGKYLEIAYRALDEITENQSLKESESKSDSPTQCELSELSEISPGDRSRARAAKIDWGKSPLVQSVSKLSKELRDSPYALRRAAGDDWEEVSADIVGFADALAVNQIRESGGIPDHYTAQTDCKRCGPVPIWPGCPPQVDGCPWCFNRIGGFRMQKSTI